MPSSYQLFCDAVTLFFGRIELEEFEEVEGIQLKNQPSFSFPNNLENATKIQLECLLV
jgi:hypothetical protein